MCQILNEVKDNNFSKEELKRWARLILDEMKRKYRSSVNYLESKTDAGARFISVKKSLYANTRKCEVKK
jgi:hypothetical protein